MNLHLTDALESAAREAEQKERVGDAFLFRAAALHIKDLQDYKLAWAKLYEEKQKEKDTYAKEFNQANKDGLEFP